MRKYFFILLLCYSSMMAQNTNSDYQAFRKGVLGSYDSFRKTVLEDYAEYLQGIWDEYEQFRGIKRDKELGCPVRCSEKQMLKSPVKLLI